MGTSVAVIFANLYFGWHEKVLLLPKYQDNFKRILFHARFIDDVFFIWIGGQDTMWHELCSDYNSFGILKWDIENPRAAVNFLDLTLKIEDGRITTKTYQKANNPYLYIPPNSAHPPGMINGTVYGLLKTYKSQNTKNSDFKHFAHLLFKRLCNQGWDQAVLSEVFLSALKKLHKSNQVPPQATIAGPAPSQDPQERLFFHQEYHPKDIPRRQIRKAYSEECEETFRAEIGTKQFILAYSRPKTIGNIVAKAQLFEVNGREVSKFITGELS